MEFIRTFGELRKEEAPSAGGKGASLGEMTRAKMPVPPGFVILSTAFERFLEETDLNVEIDAILHTVKTKKMHTVEYASEKIQTLMLRAQMPEDIAKEITSGFKELNAQYVAVRSSATAEDSATAAWAGQLDSFLNTTKGDLLKNVQKCWSSLFTPRAIFYRFEKGIKGQKISVAVVVQKMVKSEMAGVAFSVHPVTEDYNQLIIEAGFGLGEAIVSGQITPDSYVVEKEPLRILDINVNMDKRVLDDKRILELSELILKIEKHYGFPCDIEWAFEKERFYITQSRPITTLQTKTSNVGHPAFELLIEDFKVTPFVIHRLGYVMAVKLKRYLPDSPRCLFQFVNHNINWFAEIDKWDKSAQDIVEQLIKDPYSYDSFNKELREHTHALKERASKLYAENLSGLSLDVLAEHYRNVMDAYEEVYARGMVPTIADMHIPFLTNALKSLLGAYTNDVEQAFIVLTSSGDPSELLTEERDLLEISLDKTVSRKSSRIRRHHQKYFWLTFGYEGPVYSENTIWNKVEEYRKNSSRARAKLRELSSHEKDTARNIRQSEKKLKLPQKVAAVFAVAREWLFLKGMRKEAFFAAYAAMDALAEAMARNLNVSKEHIKFLTRREVEQSLSEKMFPKNVEQRFRNMVFAFENNGELVLVDDDANAYLAKNVKAVHVEHLDEIKGQIAYMGKVKGRAKLVREPADMGKMNEGDILVSPATNPNLLPAMQKAAAFVTDVGGITCHAAIVAREMKKPCVIGTKNATHIINDDDFIEVDADKGVVRVLKKGIVNSTARAADKSIKIEDITGNVELELWLERKDVSPFVVSLFHVLEISPLKALIGGGYSKEICIMRDGVSYWLRPVADLVQLPNLHRDFIIHSDVKGLRILLEHAIQIYDSADENIKVIQNASNAQFSKNIGKFLKNVSNILLYTTSIPYYLLMALEHGNAEEGKHKLVQGMCEKLRGDSKYVRAQSVFMSKLTSFLKTRHQFSVKEAENITYDELVALLSSKTWKKDKQMLARSDLSVFWLNTVKDKHEFVYEPEVVRRLLNMYVDVKPELNREVVGSVAYKGFAQGKVAIVNSLEQIRKVHKGDVIVSRSTNPSLMPALIKCAAIVTDEGGIGSHAAIVSRELKKPCIIGTKVATKVFKDGDFVEVDAYNGKVRLLK